ncbi:putative aldouronate transport system permease protein [Anaerocolumna jejuensis DSM 15929]|uniref:Putative aldouronate transport system permease protein n=1 Tax=Anaerocolumna jejuensis DSM 15929 TaxID=1121322 RepID=A0A1M6ZWD5_9FIRM|nr:carbohydrate ABC transporter permease [Anaerocolumna jejuensis]SHL34807.1 putative aldouronate transport system permease protein [Anaerocolumna jejuensis DSM 15929]
MVEKSKTFQIVAHTIMIVLCLFCVIPILLLISSSITAEGTLMKSGYSILPGKIDLTAYKYLLFDSNSIVRGYAVSIIVTVIGTLINLTLTTLLAYPLSKKNLPGRNILAFFVFFTMLFNGGLVPSYMMWTQMFHIKNTIWALIIPNLMLGAFNVIMMRAYFATNIPEEVMEAAKVDGAGEMRILLRIVLPMSLPILATLVLLVGLGYWNDWVNGLYYVNKDEFYSIQVFLNKMLQNIDMLKKAAAAGASGAPMPSTAIRMAVAVIGAVPILIIYPFFQRYFVKGIVVGAVKG